MIKDEDSILARIHKRIAAAQKEQVNGASLAATIKLHTGMTKEDFTEIMYALLEASIDSGRYDWGPSFEIAQRRLTDARLKMQQFLSPL